MNQTTLSTYTSYNNIILYSQSHCFQSSTEDGGFDIYVFILTISLFSIYNGIRVFWNINMFGTGWLRFGIFLLIAIQNDSTLVAHLNKARACEFVKLYISVYRCRLNTVSLTSDDPKCLHMPSYESGTLSISLHKHAENNSKRSSMMLT